MLKVGRKAQADKLVNEMCEITALPPPNPDDPSTFKFINHPVKVPQLAYSGFHSLKKVKNEYWFR